jgi:deazaflavin-dependent oxidoreductase (nitroreductase family)
VLRENPPASLKLTFKIPTLIYRAGLGRLLGKRFLLLVHRGRKSELERQVVLEVIHHEANPPSAAVLSGWGTRSQWFRNIQASPPLAVCIGRERWAEPEVAVLEPDEVVEVVEEYRRNHGFLMWTLDRFFGWPWKATAEEKGELARDLTVIMFSPAKVPDDEAAATELPFGVRSKIDPQANSG